MESDTLASQLLPAATALAGLILVFLGGVFNAYESYDTEQKSAVRAKYQLRGWLAFSGFVLALFAAAVAWLVQSGNITAWLNLAASALALSFLLLIVVAALAMKEVK